MHRPVGDLDDDSADDEDLSEAAVTFAREQVEMKETPKPQQDLDDTFEGTSIELWFTSRKQHWKLNHLTPEVIPITKGALQGLPGGIKVEFGVFDGEGDFQFYATESGATETNVPEPLGAEIAQANGYGTASNLRALYSNNIWIHTLPTQWTQSGRHRDEQYSKRTIPGCGVYVNFALVNAKQAR